MSPKRFSLLIALCCASSFIRPVYAAPDPDEAVASVDGVPITHGNLDQTLEGIYGEQMLPQLIDTQLLANALAARGQSVSDEEVDAELTRLEGQDAEVKTAVSAGGPRVEIIKNQVRRNLTVQKLLTARIANPTQDQLQKFFATYASYYGTRTQNRLGLLAATTKARTDQLVHTLHVNPGAFGSLVKEQQARSATDPVGGQSTADVGRFEAPAEFSTSRGIPPAIVAPITKGLTTAKKGTVLPVLALTPKGPYLIVKVVDHKDATHPTLAQMQREVKTDYKMAQVAIAEIKKNPMNPQSLADNIRQVMQLMSQPDPQTGESSARPSLRDVLTYILRPASNTTLDYLRTHSSVTITDPAYKSVASQYRTRQ